MSEATEAEALHTFLRTRRSVRRFRSEPVSTEVIERILESASYAPSSHDVQPWRFAVLPAGETRDRLAAAMSTELRRDLLSDGSDELEIEKRIRASRERLRGAPAAVLLCLDGRSVDVYSDERRRAAAYMMAAQSVAAAGLQLLLAAHAEGLAGVWVCSPLFAPQAVKTALELPPSWEPEAMFYLGYGEADRVRKVVRPLDEITVWM